MWPIDPIRRLLDSLLGVPPAPAGVRVAFSPTETPMPGLVATPSVTSPAGTAAAKVLVTYTINGGDGGVVDALAGGTFACAPGDAIVVTAVNVSPGGVASDPSPAFKFAAVDNTTKPAAPTSIAVAFAPGS